MTEKMKQENLKQLVSKGESQEVEFKRSLSLTKEGLQALCGMINTDKAHGAVIFGVEDNGTIVGIEPGNVDTAQRSLVQCIGDTFEPRLHCKIKMSVCDGMSLLILEAIRDKNISFYEYDSRAWIREGTTTRCLTLQEKQNFERKRNRDMWQGPWTCDKCGTRAGQFNQLVFSECGTRKTYQCTCGGEFWPAS